MNPKVIISWILLSVFILSCYENKEGCNDILASNYDVSYDVPCESCCSYPKIYLKCNHKYLGKELVFNDTSLTSLGKSFYLLQQKFYFGNVSLYSKGKLIDFITSYNYSYLDGKQSMMLKDYCLFINNQARSEVNNFRNENSIDSIKYIVGMDPKFDNLNVNRTTSLPELDKMNGIYLADKKSFGGYYLKLIAGKSLKDTIAFFYENDLQLMSKLTPVKSQFGQNIDINLNLNYNAFLDSIDFSLDKANIQMALKSRINKLFE